MGNHINPNATIVSCDIIPSDISEMRFQSTVQAVWSDATKSVALRFFEDELTFTEEELIGLTQKQVDDLFLEKDMAYLQS